MLRQVFLAFIFILPSIQSGYPEGLTVHTAEGDVLGTLTAPTVRRFLGIPYAVANRWEAPQKPPIRNAPFNATKFGDSCPQALALPPGGDQVLGVGPAGNINAPESEDCLNVNIWAPSIRRKQGTAVMIWIYGGRFLFGTSNTPSYDGQYLVGDHADVLVASFNYRTNIFGQPGAPQLSVNGSQTQNFGLLDIDAAVKWVYENIAAFGGDPERITLFGQSAGATATDAYSYMHPDDSIVKGVIQQSGNLGIIDIVAPMDSKNWNLVSNAVGCGTVSDAAQMNCMENIPYRTLKEAVIATGTSFLVLIDDITVFSDLDARASAGDFLRVPLLAGSTQHEADIILVAQQLFTPGYVMPILTEMLSDIYTQIAYTCPTAKTVTDRIDAGVRTWRYQYQGVFPDLSIRPDLRAYHLSDVPLVFGAFYDFYNVSGTNNGVKSTAPPPTTDELALSEYMQCAWVAFARDPAKGLLDFGWPMYNADPMSNVTMLVELGGFYNRTGASFTNGRSLDFTCGARDVLLDVQGKLSTLLNNASVFMP